MLESVPRKALPRAPISYAFGLSQFATFCFCDIFYLGAIDA